MRRARVEDADDIARLDMQLFPDSCFNEKTFADELAAGYGWVCYDGAGIHAYAVMRLDGDFGDLIRIGVHPNYQGMGIGTQLLGLIMASPVNQMMLTVRKKNHGAVRLYLRLGYEIVGQLEAYGEQSWVMLITCVRL